MLNPKSGAFFLFALLMSAGSPVDAQAAIPSKIQDDTAIYQKLSEIKISKEADLDFEGDIMRLAQLESRYVENHLPSIYKNPKLKRAVDRVSRAKYRRSGQEPSQVALRERVQLRKKLRATRR
ncbi:MAG: hypothetical protein AB7F66_02105 [Bacteriovoracia bacterium]